MTYFVYENVSSCSCKFINGEIYEFLIVVCLRFALIIITWQINNYYVLNHFIQLLLVFRFHFIVIIQIFVKMVDTQLGWISTNIVLIILILTEKDYCLQFMHNLLSVLRYVKFYFITKHHHNICYFCYCFQLFSLSIEIFQCLLLLPMFL